MSDELIDRLGSYFVYHNIRERMAITFERFVNIYLNGRWGDYIGYNPKPEPDVMDAYKDKVVDEMIDQIEREEEQSNG